MKTQIEKGENKMRHFKKIKQEKTNKGMLLGIRKDGQKVWLSEPKWDCGWYWGFGYLGEYSGREIEYLDHSEFQKLIYNNFKVIV